MPLSLKSLLTPRFFKFCTVGASGVLVNLFCFYLFADVVRMHVHAALVLAIEISILSNFAVNEAWTFRDRRAGAAGRVVRAAKFHAVSLVGGGIQWLVFAAVNALLLWNWLDPPAIGVSVDFISRYVTDPADAGNFKYLAQLTGIGMATLFNFYANVKWTWGRPKEAGDGD